MHLFLGSNYSSTKHSQINFMKLLEDAFTDNHFLNQLTLKHLQEKTGLSSTAITAWFKWKRSETGYLTPKQVTFLLVTNRDSIVCGLVGYRSRFQSLVFVSVLHIINFRFQAEQKSRKKNLFHRPSFTFLRKKFY